MSTSNEPRSPEHSESAHWGHRTSTLDSFLWEEAPSLDKNLILSLAKCDFIAARQNVIFCGPIACGKSHLANSLADLALQAGYSVNLVDGPRLDVRFSWQSCLESYLIDCDLLVVDDPRPTEQLREILKQRRNRSTLLVSNRPAAELLEALMPREVRFDPLRETWISPVVVEFKENGYGLKLRSQR